MKVEPLSEHVGVLISAPHKASVLDLDPNDIKGLFQESGAVLLRGLDVDLAMFEDFSNRFSNDYVDSKGSGSVRETINPQGDSTIQSVSYSYGVIKQRAFGLPLHADRSYTKIQPVLMWFYCVRPAATDGETTVCDGVKLYESLSDSTRELFHRKRLKYLRHYPDGQWQLLYHTKDINDVKQNCLENGLSLTVNDDGSIRTEFLKSAIVETKWGHRTAFTNSILIVQWQEDDLDRKVSIVRFEDGGHIPNDVLDEVKEVSRDLTYAVPWQRGDLLMIDNTRVMHGRHAFTDPDRTIYVRMCRSVDW